MMRKQHGISQASVTVSGRVSSLKLIVGCDWKTRRREGILRQSSHSPGGDDYGIAVVKSPVVSAQNSWLQG